MKEAFKNCVSITTLDLSGWDTFAVYDAYDLFRNCTSLSSCKIGKSYQIKGSDMFPDATADNGKWWSMADRQWYTKDEIVDSRSGVADTYTLSEGVTKATQTITAPDVTVAMGKTATLAAKTTGDGALTFKSSDTSVVKVNGTSGKLTPVHAGSATVTVTAAETDGYKKATKKVAVTVSKGTPVISASGVTVQMGATATIAATATGDGAITYASSDTSVVRVNGTSGKLTPVKQGTATVTVTSAATADWKKVTVTATVTVLAPKKAQRITASDKSVVVGKTVKLAATTSGDGKLAYKSSDASVAKVSSSGIVTGVHAGTATITITAAETEACKKATKKVTITVTKATQTITASDRTVAMGKTATIAAKTTGDGALAFRSSDTSVVKVNSTTGKLKPVHAGTATIIITASETEAFKKATKKVTVTVSKGTPAVTAPDVTVAMGATATISAKTTGDGALAFRSSDTSVVKVNGTSGKLTPVHTGTATITITASETDDYKKATTTVKVTVTGAGKFDPTNFIGYSGFFVIQDTGAPEITIDVCNNTSQTIRVDVRGRIEDMDYYTSSSPTLKSGGCWVYALGYYNFYNTLSDPYSEISIAPGESASILFQGSSYAKYSWTPYSYFWMMAKDENDNTYVYALDSNGTLEYTNYHEWTTYVGAHGTRDAFSSVSTS